MQENVSILETIVADMPDLFYSEILPKIDLLDTLNLAKVSKSYRDAVWSVDGVRSLGAKLESAFEKLKLASKASRIPFRPIPQSVFTEPIHWAAGRGNLPAVRALLDSGVDVDKAATYHRIFPNTRYGSSGVNSTEGEIALQCAAKKGHLAVVKALIKAGADVNRQDNYENTALGAATAQGSTLVVMELIKAGADVNLADDMGATPIFSAAELGNSIIVALLIQAGADVNRIDEDDMKPIDLALRYSNDDDWREDLGANGASIEEYKKCVEMLRYAAS